MADSNITKRALAASLKELMEKQAFAKVSVGEICAHCGMNRKSFYYHFEDKYSLLNWIFYTEFLESALQVADGLDSRGFLRLLVQHFYQERRFYLNALAVRGQNSLWEYFIEVMTPFLRVIGEEQFAGQLDHRLCEILLEGVLSVIYRWLSQEEEMPPEELFARMNAIYEGLEIVE